MCDDVRQDMFVSAHVLENVPMLRNGTVRTRDTSQRMSRAVNKA